ncbi:MAG: hypothetical protein IIA77_00080 [Proteobacteria bacterium]|nr:hypothetical protein [Pseudomonadota bacterium]
MDKKKKYGNVTVGTLHYLVESLTELEKFKSELSELTQQSSEDKKEKLIGDNFSWVRLYRHPFYKNLLALLFISGFSGVIKKVIKRKPTNLTEEVIDEIKSFTEYTGGPFGIFKGKHLIASFYPIAKSVDAISLYGTTMNRLLKRATEENGDEAFFQAVRVDRSVISYKGMTSRIARAEMEGDEEFFKHLRNALTAKVGDLSDYALLRFILATLHESNALDSLTQKEAYELLVTELRLYPKTGANPESSLWQYISRWKKDFDFDMKK